MSRPLDYDVSATASRRTWEELPGSVRSEIERRLGSPVVRATSQGSGFTPGFASRLMLANRSRAFVKAADDTMQPDFTASYREEARKVSALPAAVPTPALRWSYDADGWVVLCFDDVGGRPPHRPWRADELAATLRAVTAMSQALTPAPVGLELPQLGDELADFPAYWERVDPGAAFGGHASEVVELAHLGLAAGSGDTLVHCDLRGDGHDADVVLRRNPLSADVDVERIDAVLALLTGYFLGAATQDVPATSPWLRRHQRWYAEVLVEWLAQRRRWR